MPTGVGIDDPAGDGRKGKVEATRTWTHGFRARSLRWVFRDRHSLGLIS